VDVAPFVYRTPVIAAAFLAATAAIADPGPAIDAGYALDPGTRWTYDVRLERSV
jgi:hypothetical protein